MGVTTILLTGLDSPVGWRVRHDLSFFGEDRPEVRLTTLDTVDPEGSIAAVAEPEWSDTDAVVAMVDWESITDLADGQTEVDRIATLVGQAAGSGVQHVVVVTTALAYGAWENQQTPITEEAQLRPNPNLPGAQASAELERRLIEIRQRHPGTIICVLRPALILGERPSSLALGLARGSRLVDVKDSSPDLQFVHAEDVVSALRLAIDDCLDGVYNVAARGTLPSSVQKDLHGSSVRPTVRARTAARILRRFGQLGISTLSDSAVPLLSHPIVVATDKLAARGWKAGYSNEEAVLATAAPRSRGALLAGGVAAALIGAAAFGATRRRGTA
jgi:nucleoside-diphosphate-sugar epimerase